MIKRKNLTIILLIGVLVMNTGILCESLCLTGHSNMADSPIPHDDMISHSKPVPASFKQGHESSETQACPISETHNHSDNVKSKTFIKCDCSSDNELSISDVILLSEEPFNLTPQNYLISSLIPYKSTFNSAEPNSLERPPQIPA